MATFVPSDYEVAQWENAPSAGTPLDETHLEGAEQSLADRINQVAQELADYYQLDDVALRKLKGSADTPENHGARRDGVVFTDASIDVGSPTILTSSAIQAGDAGKLVYVMGAGASTSLGTTGPGALSTGAPITAIPCTALAADIPKGSIVIASGGHAQEFGTSGAVAGATSIPVTSQTPSFAFPAGSSIRTLGAGLATTILGASNGSATLNAAASSTVNNALGWVATDDTAAILAAQDAACANGSGTVLYEAGNYGVGATPDHSRYGNAQIPLPTFEALLGDNVGNQFQFGFAVAHVGVPGKTRLLSTSMAAYSSSYGPPSVIGAPTTEGTTTAGKSGFPVAAELHVKGLMICAPENPSINGVDAIRYQDLVWDEKTARCLAGPYVTGWRQKSNNGADIFKGRPQTNKAFGIRACGAANYGRQFLKAPECFGFYCGVVIGTQAQLIQGATEAAVLGIGIDVTSMGGGVGSGAVQIQGHTMEGVQYLLGGYDPVNGAVSLALGTDIRVLGHIIFEDDGGPFTLAANPVLNDNGGLDGELLYDRYGGAFYLPGWTLAGGPRLLLRPISRQVIAPSFDDSILDLSPLAFVPMDELSGAAARDLSGNGHAGTYVASPVLGVSGPLLKGDKSPKLNGSSQYVALDHLGTLGSNLGSATIVLMFKTTGTGTFTFVGVEFVATGANFAINANMDRTNSTAVGKTQLALFDANMVHHRYGEINVGLYDGNWHIIHFQPSATGTHLCWVDGIPRTVTMETTPGTLNALADLTANVFVGALNANGVAVNFLPGRIAKAAFWTTRLTQAQIQAQANALLR